MEIYLLKSAACLAVLLLFYKLLLERENMHVFKRFYLLLSVIAAITIPLITFTTYVEPSAEAIKRVLITSEAAPESAGVNYRSYIFMLIYIPGVVFFSIKFIKNLHTLVLKIQSNPKVRENDITNVLLSEKTPPHTFFNYIFFNKQKFLRNEIHRDVKVHEEAHARQRHSFDVIFVELLQIIFWFNPLIFLLKNYIKLNHEFLADKAVLQRGFSTSHYQQTLLSYSSGDLQSDLVNPINYSSIKKRFTVMKTQTSRNVILTRSLLLLPLLAGLLYGFSTAEVVEKNIASYPLHFETSKVLEINVDKAGSIFINNTRVSRSELKKLDLENYKSYSIKASPDAPDEIIKQLVQFGASNKMGGTVLMCNAEELQSGNEVKPGKERKIQQQKKATPREIATYNRLVKYYNEMPKDRRVVKQEDANKIMAILSKMSPEQRENAERINFDVPPPPPPAPAPVPPVPEGDELMPPPPPPSPIESVKEWIEEGAAFYYKGKAISGEEALKIVQKNNGKNLSVQVEERNSKKTVRLSDKL